jgi:hypothetical protein
MSTDTWMQPSDLTQTFSVWISHTPFQLTTAFSHNLPLQARMKVVVLAALTMPITCMVFLGKDQLCVLVSIRVKKGRKNFFST